MSRNLIAAYTDTEKYREAIEQSDEITTEHEVTGTPMNTPITATVKQTSIKDCGLLVDSLLQFSEAEWRRVGLEKHWNHDEAVVNHPAKRRRLEVTAGRDELALKNGSGEVSFDHLDPLPEDSPLISEWEDPEGSSKPPVPLSRPYARFYAARTEDVRETNGAERIEVCSISAVETTDERRSRIS